MANEVFTCCICKSFSAKTFTAVLRHIGKLERGESARFEESFDGWRLLYWSILSICDILERSILPPKVNAPLPLAVQYAA